MNDLSLRLILDNLRSSANVGSIMRTADSCNVELIYACGYTPYPTTAVDNRPPHVISSNLRQIAKTALGAEKTLPVEHRPNTLEAIAEAKRNGFTIIIIEQAEGSLSLFDFAAPSHKLALVLGNEVSGVESEALAAADYILEIPMSGQKESLGVAVAAGIALYQLTYGRPH